MHLRLSCFLASFVLISASLRADVRCAAVFGDRMVLQRERPVAIWGEASAQEHITVEFAGQTVATTAGADGHWRADLAPMPASAESRPLTVHGSNTVTFSDVLVGEVWLCSGQSNMEKPLGPRRGQKPTDNYEAEIAAGNHPLLRLYQMPQYGKPQKGVLGQTWIRCSPDALKQTDFSAAGYYFGRELQQVLGVPVGVIHSSFGGTNIEAWISAAAFADHPAVRPLRDVKYFAWVKGVQATELYNSMIAPLAPYAVRGFLWYQGENNVMQADDGIYTDKMRALIDGWRSAWHEPQAPWYFVQLAPFDYSKWDKFPKLLTPEELPVFWEAQERALAIPHTGMVVTTDLVTNLHDIHPTNKRDVGLRLARLALVDTYGRTDVAGRSPRFARLVSTDGGRLTLQFADVGDGLRTRDGKPASDFVIAGADRHFVPATAEVHGDTVVLSSAQVKQPVAARFAWFETATPNLVNSANLPAMPFRTDDWPVVRDRPRPPQDATAADLDNVFHRPPESAKPWVFWYWMYGAVTKEGIAVDLAAMKQAGLEGAYLMPIKGPAQPPLLSPPMVQLTPEWWDCVKFAFSEADRLGLKLALQDCDGFATAGGPWITPEQSMQKVVWSETPVAGGQHVDVVVKQPDANEGYYRDIAIYAVPLSVGRGLRSAPRPEAESRPYQPADLATVTTDKQGPAPQFLAGAGTGKDVFESKAACWIQFAYPQPFTVRAVTIKLPPAANAYQPNTYQANRLSIEASDDGQHYRPVTQLMPPRHGWQDGDADVTHAIPATTARYFRFRWDPAGGEPGAEDLDSAKWKPVLKLRAITLSSTPKLDGFEGKSGAVWRVTPPTTAEEIAAADCVPLDRVVDLTSKLAADGHLRWDAPTGEWTILRMGHTSTGHHNETGGGGRGLECDKFDPAVVKSQYEHWFGEAVRQVGPDLAQRVLKIFHVDSWECGSQNWSPVFREEFKRRRGYDPLRYLPVMAGIPLESVDVSERFLRDVRTTIAELIADNFYGTMAQLAHAQGCEFTAESVAPTMVSDGMAHFAHVDSPMGEFWLRSPTNDKLNDILDATSGAHVYGRSVAVAEAFTELSLAWDESPRILKALQDRNYTFGINRYVYHVFAHNPWPNRRPGVTLNGVGTFFGATQTWWKPGAAWVEYAQRCQALLQQGHPVADIAVFTGEEIPRRAVVPWELHSTLPAMVGEAHGRSTNGKTSPIIEAGDWIDPLHGYAYDSINRDALLRLAEVRNGRLELPGGASYRVLVVPATNRIDPIANRLTPEVTLRLREFAAAGLTVILGDRPVASASLHEYPAADRAVAGDAQVLWPRDQAPDGASHALGKGRVVTGPFTASSFAPLGLQPDVSVLEAGERSLGAPGSQAAKTDSAREFAWTHRAGDGWDLYFLSNHRGAARDVTVSFRASNRVPELWDAVTGRQETAPHWHAADGRTEVPLHFAPNGSIFVVFRLPGKAPATAGTDSVYNFADPAITETLDGRWTVSFDPANGGPTQPVTFDRLGSWTTQADAAVRNYSGTATYVRTLTWTAPVKAPRHVWLDLGEVRDIAEVTVNGMACGVAWTPPFRVDIAPALHAGSNELRIAVTNTWFNRLAADRSLPETQRITSAPFAPDRTEGKPPLEAGLLGPVTLRVEN